MLQEAFLAFLAGKTDSFGVIAQLVERLNGIEEVWGSNPHGSISHKYDLARGERRIGLGQVFKGANPHGSISHKFNLAGGEIRIGLGRVSKGPIPMAP